jgi:phenylalanyl-tRNA synthetase alpha chain
MIHPTVLRAGTIDPRKYTGFAFGCGLDRIAMLRWGIDDIRLVYNGDLRLVNQF